MSSKFSEYMRKNREALGSKTAKIGGYNFVLTLIVLGIIVAINVLVKALPSTLTQFDISAAQLYSVTSDTKVVVNNLNKDVTIYWLTQSGKEDPVIEKLLNIYDDMSEHITVDKKNPDVYPTFAEKYTDENVSNNSLVVESGDRYRYIPFSDIYETDTSDYYATGSVSQSFDGESEITTAIDYVVSEDLPKAYFLTGHGEAETSETFKNALLKGNYETEDFSLLNVDEVPEEADIVIINAPTSDISDKEKEMLGDYLDNGGHLMVFSGPNKEDAQLTNLNSILESLGVSINKGIVIEGSRDHYAFGQGYILLPDINSSDITDVLIDEKSYVIMPIAAGLTVGSSSGSYAVTPLLTTSDESFAKAAGYDLTTYDKEDEDVDGPFTLAISAENSTTGSKIVWFASDVLLEESYNSYSSGANVDIAMNAISWTIGDEDSVSIRAKSLDYNYLTISDSNAKKIKIILIGAIPALYLLYGVEEILRRRKGVTTVEA